MKSEDKAVSKKVLKECLRLLKEDGLTHVLLAYGSPGVGTRIHVNSDSLQELTFAHKMFDMMIDGKIAQQQQQQQQQNKQPMIVVPGMKMTPGSGRG